MNRDGLGFTGGFGNAARDNFLKFELENEVGTYLRINSETDKIYIRLFSKTGRLLSEGYFNKSASGTTLVDVELNEEDLTIEFTFSDGTSIRCDMSPLYGKIYDLGDKVSELDIKVDDTKTDIINHKDDSVIHITSIDRDYWDSKLNDAAKDNRVYGRKDGDWIEIDPNANVGRTFTTNVTVGYLSAGTELKDTDKLKDIIYKMLYKEITAVPLYTGAFFNIPSDSDIDTIDPIDVEIEDLLSGNFEINIKTGSYEPPYAQYTTIACNKEYELSEWKNKESGLGYNIKTVESDKYNIYYKEPSNFDINVGGENFILKFIRS